MKKELVIFWGGFCSPNHNCSFPGFLFLPLHGTVSDLIVYI